jgi:hypothetical protein
MNLAFAISAGNEAKSGADPVLKPVIYVRRCEEGTLAKLKALRAELIDPAVVAHGGRIFKTTGDGLLTEFSSDRRQDGFVCPGVRRD